ncbi:MAG: hypothetical protein ACI8XW_001214 [Gammaproteobacteria bacterium]|jgi:uncharacterized protein YjiS (DUF1127 family)
MLNFNKTIGQLFTLKRLDPEVRAREAEIAQAIRFLKACNGRELRDMGIPRSDIARVVRYGTDDNVHDLRSA